MIPLRKPFDCLPPAGRPLPADCGRHPLTNSSAHGWVTDLTAPALQTVTAQPVAIMSAKPDEMAVVDRFDRPAPPAPRLPYLASVRSATPRKQRPALLSAVNNGTTEIVLERNPHAPSAGKPNRPADGDAPRLQKAIRRALSSTELAACASASWAPVTLSMPAADPALPPPARSAAGRRSPPPTRSRIRSRRAAFNRFPSKNGYVHCCSVCCRGSSPVGIALKLLHSSSHRRRRR